MGVAVMATHLLLFSPHHHRPRRRSRQSAAGRVTMPQAGPTVPTGATWPVARRVQPVVNSKSVVAMAKLNKSTQVASSWRRATTTKSKTRWTLKTHRTTSVVLTRTKGPQFAVNVATLTTATTILTFSISMDGIKNSTKNKSFLLLSDNKCWTQDVLIL